MSFYSHSENRSTPDLVPVSGLAPSQSRPVHPWSEHAPPIGKSPSPFPRDGFTLTMTTSACDMLLFGGCIRDSRTHMFRCSTNDLFVISTWDFSTTLLQTGGDIPSPRHGHCAVLTGTNLLIWGGAKRYDEQVLDDSLYLFDILSLDWTRIVVNGPGPAGRFYHSMTLVGSKLFVFGGRSFNRHFDDIWALDLNCLISNLFWELYEPAPESEKPLPRSGHVSVTSGDHIIMSLSLLPLLSPIIIIICRFGGYGGTHGSKKTWFNDTWSFNISTRKWTELQCTGSIPSPRTGHAAVLIDDFIYVFGGSRGETRLGDLTAFSLSTQRWIAFQDTGPSPCERFYHGMACDGTRIFVIGGGLSENKQDETKPIHILDTRHLDYPNPDSDSIDSSERTSLLVQRSSASTPARGQPHQPPSSLDAQAADLATPFQRVLDHLTSQQTISERNSSLNGPRPTGASGRPRRVPEDSDSEVSTEYRAKPVAPSAPSGKGMARLDNGRLIELERQLSESLVAQTERDRHIGRLTDELAHAMEEKERAGQELRKLQTQFDESLLSHNHALDQTRANATDEMRRAALELHEFQVKFDRLLLSRDRAEADAAEAKKQAGLEQRELQVKLDRLLLSRDRAEANAAEVKRCAALEQRELQVKLDESILSRDEHLRMLEQAQIALQEATSRAADADAERSHPVCEHETEVAELRAELEGKKSELAAVHFRLTSAKDGWAKGKAKADKSHTVTAATLVDLNEDQTDLTEDVQIMEAGLRSLKWSEKSVEEMDCGNEG